MPAVPYRAMSPEDSLETFLEKVARLTSTRKVRPVITPSGKRARGNMPSIKALGWARYESQLELDVLRVAEVSSQVRVIRTHPFVLALPGDRPMHYTPDAQLQWGTGGVLLETKAAYFLTQEKSRKRLKEIVLRLRNAGLGLLLVVEADVRPPGLQDELKELLRLRPSIGRRRRNIDVTRWNPLARTVVHFELERRWRAAQQECDALLQRVMRRDPDELIASVR
jgi:hypothetical protein